jgi:hypothetical protein
LNSALRINPGVVTARPGPLPQWTSWTRQMADPFLAPHLRLHALGQILLADPPKVVTALTVTRIANDPDYDLRVRARRGLFELAGFASDCGGPLLSHLQSAIAASPWTGIDDALLAVVAATAIARAQARESEGQAPTTLLGEILETRVRLPSALLALTEKVLSDPNHASVPTLMQATLTLVLAGHLDSICLRKQVEWFAQNAEDRTQVRTYARLVAKPRSNKMVRRLIEKEQTYAS